jgi:hypothetical protein
VAAIEQGEAFFVEGPDGYAPSSMARSPWSATMLHGRLLAGLAARAIEQEHGDPAFLPTRLTVDMFRSPPMAPITVRTARVRDGHRVRAVDATLSSGGHDVARASAVLLRRAEQPEGTVWQREDWHVPAPERLPLPEARPGWEPSWETRRITEGGFDAVSQKRTWLREARPLVAGEALSPLQRAAMAADIANPLSNAGDRGLEFINADLTLYLHRLPRSDWLGLETTGHQSAEGIAVGSCDIYDLDGRLGYVAVCSVANTKDPAAAARAAGRWSRDGG